MKKQREKSAKSVKINKLSLKKEKIRLLSYNDIKLICGGAAPPETVGGKACQPE